MTELATTESASLALAQDQDYFTPAQVKALEHIGVENASPGDLQVFHHVCQRTGLDPFARQIYMIGRKSKVKEGNDWVDGPVKQTIQTGIDGFRLIGRRAANAAGHMISVKAPEWAHMETGWQEVWVGSWGHPVAARFTIMRDGEPFTAVALFDEYKQTKWGGKLTSMWEQRPAGQLAKCAEALAWRMAFPQDLSGIYTDDEMAQAENSHAVQGEVIEQRQTGGLAAALKNSGPEVSQDASSSSDSVAPEGDVGSPGPESPVDAEIVEKPITAKTRKHMFALFTQKGVEETEQLPGINHITGKTYTSRADVTEDDALRVIEVLLTRDDAPKADQ